MYKLLPILLFAYGLAVTTDDIYDNSYALIIGINEYEHVQKLTYAVSDAESIHEMLMTLFDFPEENITILKNEEANKKTILNSLLDITNQSNSKELYKSVSLVPIMIEKEFFDNNLGFLYETPADENPLNTFPDLPYVNITDPVQGLSRQLTAYDVTIDMLLKNNTAEILANSEVVTLNGHTATIDMIDQIPYLAQSSGQSGNMQVFKEIVGIRLEILPTVNSDGYITTEVTPEVSSIVDWTAQGYPWTKKRKSTTTIRVKDGETIVIAGLVTNETLTTESKFPLLWRLPWLGRKLFTHTLEEDKKTDLIIQVKPTIIKDNYSGIKKQFYHEDAEKKLDVKEPYETKDND